LELVHRDSHINILTYQDVKIYTFAVPSTAILKKLAIPIDGTTQAPISEGGTVCPVAGQVANLPVELCLAS